MSIKNNSKKVQCVCQFNARNSIIISTKIPRNYVHQTKNLGNLFSGLVEFFASVNSYSLNRLIEIYNSHFHLKLLYLVQVELNSVRCVCDVKH